MQEVATAYTDTLPGRTLKLDGKEYLYFSGTSYLGMSFNPSFRECVLEGIDHYGTNFSGSRNSNLKLKVFDEAEHFLACFTGAEAALTMSSGYLAGQLLVQHLKSKGKFIYAPGAHPAVWRKSSDDSFGKYEDWVLKMQGIIQESDANHYVIVCNSLDPLHARSYCFDWIKLLPKDKQITIVVDDSHGFGITGQDGAGCYRKLKALAPEVCLMVVSSLGKAFGVPAGVVLGDKDVIDNLKLSNCFGGASPANPAYLYAFIKSKEIYNEAREKLFNNIAYFKKKASSTSLFESFDNYPVFYTQYNELNEHLLQDNIMISSFRYPTPADEPITRVVLNSLHTPEDLDILSESINNFAVIKPKCQDVG